MVTLEEFMEIFKLKEQGLTISAISRETGLGRKTVRKYLKQGKSKAPKMKKRKPRTSKLNAFESNLQHYIDRPENQWPPARAVTQLISPPFRI